MAALTDETRASLAQGQQHSKEQNEQFKAQAEAAVKSWRNATQAAERAAERLEQAAWRMELRHYLLAVLTGVMTGLLASAFWLWLAPAPVVQNSLDAKAVAELLRSEIAALKPSRGK
ncbi:mobilization protein [Duganella margarita]|uniref:mobilization protein n=1 Tax=Duganella margarita TaxID=2692170 RepID=UPI001E62D04F|nr:mobilization protein [Duganella margarita]